MNAAVEELGSVIAVGQQSRAELAGELARQFRRDPGTFDPRTLERLGASGLRQFLGEIGAGNVLQCPSDLSRRPQPRQAHARDKSTPSGWRHLRRLEWSVWASGVAAGVRAGSVVIGAGLFILFSAERIAPFVREALS